MASVVTGGKGSRLHTGPPQMPLLRVAAWQAHLQGDKTVHWSGLRQQGSKIGAPRRSHSTSTNYASVPTLVWCNARTNTHWR